MYPKKVKKSYFSNENTIGNSVDVVLSQLIGVIIIIIIGVLFNRKQAGEYK